MQSWKEVPLSIWLRSDVPIEPRAYVIWRDTQALSFFFNSTSDIASALRTRFSPPVSEAESAVAGHWRYFSGPVFSVGPNPDWHRNPMTGQKVPSSRHWSELGDFDYGDIKLVWEASRFSFVYPLLRAYVFTGDERYAQTFWQLLEHWAQHNPPNTGPNWMSGQELAFRVMTWCFALYGFRNSPLSSPERVANLVAMIAVHSQRIQNTLDYARSQKNNHALSEAVALLTVGFLFPELRQAQRWESLGRRVLEAEVRRQIYDDGSYLQHSIYYHRLMLQVLVWAVRLAEIHGRPLSTELTERFRRATFFLDALTDEQTGRAPNLGSNDGTLVLPLNECGYEDFRPVIQACQYALSCQRRYGPGSWDEDLLWLFGPAVIESATALSCASRTDLGPYSFLRESPLPSRHEFPIAGTYVLGENPKRAFFRCVDYHDRPGQADQLHLDLWWNGVNLACDAGTFLYNGPSPWLNLLARTFVHNTVTIDGRDQMNRVGPFLWLDWARGRVRHNSRALGGQLEFLEAEHDGYRAVNVLHRRAVLRLGCEGWLVVDDVLGPGAHRARLHWLLADLPFLYDSSAGEVQFHVGDGRLLTRTWASSPGDMSLVRGGALLGGTDPEAEVRGWKSRTYAEREFALSLAFDVYGKLPIRFITYMGVEPAKTEVWDLRSVVCQLSSGKLAVQFAEPGESPIFQDASLRGPDVFDELDLPESPEPVTVNSALTQPC
jgi:heparinase II/III-like protein